MRAEVFQPWREFMRRVWSAFFVFAAGTTWALAQQPQQQGTADTAQLVKAIQNPIANLISVPFQNNLNYPIGTFNRYQNVLNIQPVIPVGIRQWNLITRSILPVTNQPNVQSAEGSRAGLGDLNLSFFFSPAKPGKIIWSIGPAFVLPTATASMLGAGK
jgi:hypothetical protein